MSEKNETRKAFFTLREVAERWWTSERHVRREIDSGRLPAHRFGRTVRVAASDLALYEAERRGGKF